MAKTTKLVGYGISFDMKLVGGTKTADDFTRVAKSVQKGLNSASNATKSFEIAQEQLNQALRNGAISQKEYEDQLTRLRFRELKRQEQLEKQRRAVSGLDKQESILAKNRQNRARMAGMAAAGVSGLGMGGRAAGAARFLGGAAGLGGPAAALGLGFGALAMVKESISAFAELETKVAGLKSLFGEPLGEKLTVQFRNLAKTTILTNNQLIENAKTWASYGLTTDGLTDRLRRLGTVAGGNSEKFRSLTIAFAQVNAQGKLMGQEKNQLINAGFSLQAVADAAGISMENFADAMKNGEIRAEHLNEALIAVTSEGGLFADYLEKQADTINGKLTILSASWEEFLQALGKTEKGPVMGLIDGLIVAADALNQAADAWNRASGFKPGVPDPMVGQVGVVQAGDAVPSAGLRAVGKAAVVDLGGENVGKTARGAYAEGFFTGPNAEMLRQQMFEADRAIKFDQERVKEEREKEAIRNKSRDKREREQIDRLFKRKVTIADYLMQYEATQSDANRKEMQERYEKYLERYVDPYRDDPNFVGPLPESERQRMQREKDEQDLELRKRQMDTEIELARKDAKEKKEAEFELLEKQFKEREKAIAESLAIEKKLAQGPSQRDAMFTGGSVEEFMFLRRQTQENETARAVKEAEEKAARQREQIEADRKAAQEDMKSFLTDLVTNQLPQQMDKPGN